MGKACSCMQFIKRHIFYCKSRENLYYYYNSRKNPYQVLQITCAASERAMGSYDKIIIIIVPSYTGKNSFVAVGIVTHAVHS